MFIIIEEAERGTKGLRRPESRRKKLCGKGTMGRTGKMEKWRNGGMEEWRDGGMEGWRDGGMEAGSQAAKAGQAGRTD